VLGNHDEPRVATRLGARGARLAMLLLLTLRGTPTLHYGDEIGLTDVEVPPELVQDPWEKRVPGLGLGRDPERSPMPWDGSPNAGFTVPAAHPWLPLGADAGRRHVEAEARRPESMLSFTRALLALRRSHPALHRGGHRPIDGVPSEVFAYLREHGRDRALVALNFADAPRVVALPERAVSVLAATAPETSLTHADSVLLGEQEGILLELAG
jgi:alpha-glucosidase